MRRRWLLVALAVVLLSASAGCMGQSAVSDQQLGQSASYDWGSPAAANATVAVNATGGHYRAVMNLTGRNETKLRFAQASQLGGTNPVSVSAIQFRYPNGTVVNASSIAVSQSNSAVTVTVPSKRGEFAYTAPMGGGSLSVPVVLSGASYDVVLPPSTRVDIPVFGTVSPGGYERTTSGDRTRLHWASVNADSIGVHFFLMRDVYLFGGLLAAAAILAVLVVAYFRYRIRQLERDREESGLDVGK